MNPEVIQWIWSLDIDASSRLVLFCLVRYGNGELGLDNIFPSLQTIAKDCHLNVSTVKRCLNDLQSAKIIHRFRRKSVVCPTEYTSSLYRLNIHKQPVQVGALSTYPPRRIKHQPLVDKTPTVGALTTSNCSNVTIPIKKKGTDGDEKTIAVGPILEQVLPGWDRNREINEKFARERDRWAKAKNTHAEKHLSTMEKARAEQKRLRELWGIPQ